MQLFKSPEQAQTFLCAHAFIHGHFHPRRHLLAADASRAIRSIGFDVWHRSLAGHTALPALVSLPRSPLVNPKLP